MDKIKTVAESRTSQVQMIGQKDLNGYQRLFGGRLLEWIDIVAGVVARRHSGMNVTTAVIDSLEFCRPAYANDTIVLLGHITWVGRSSMEVCVQTFVENLNGSRELINKAHIIMVALGEDERPAEVPRLKIESPEQQAEWDAAVKRRELRSIKQR
ncbi:MAG: acyl-CoA thioesterase [Eubacteriales bacterium]|nr:acyl-CoA thioesterase [Eubacteriales bacterium]MDD3880640.1 acyl-CoA thioesterase [Eubacteriales bacterium]MDD4513546.1 acyl-CoA thioesterase [Eubacteriales bacterium]